MKTVLVIALILAMAGVVVSLVRGVVAFLQSHRADIDAGGDRQKEMQLLQNRMMMNRIKFQALAILVVIVLLAVAGAS
jgi:mannose/fructose/N-acetylgalactosamine-specific phosphotransferase system component IIC